MNSHRRKVSVDVHTYNMQITTLKPSLIQLRRFNTVRAHSTAVFPRMENKLVFPIYAKTSISNWIQTALIHVVWICRPNHRRGVSGCCRVRVCACCRVRCVYYRMTLQARGFMRNIHSLVAILTAVRRWFLLRHPTLRRVLRSRFEAHLEKIVCDLLGPPSSS